MRGIKLTIFLVFSFLIISCSKNETEKTGSYSNGFKKSDITIGTFNLEWFGDGINDRIDRSEIDYQHYAEIFKKMDADIIGLQEIENPGAMQRIIKYLPDYSYFLTIEGGQQKCGVLFRKNINVRIVNEYSPLAVDGKRTRPGLLLAAKAGNLSFLLMVVHLKSSSHFDNTDMKRERSIKLRTEQSEVLAKWSDSVIAKGNESDLIVVGDFNDTPKRKKNNTMYPLYGKMTFLTENEKSCKYPAAYGIDQIVVSKSLKSRLKPNSLFVYNIFSIYNDADTKALSDHCPVIAKFDVKADDVDNLKRIAKK